MQSHDTRGEIYRGWLIVLIALEDSYFYEIHSPEGYINRNLQFFDTPEEAIAHGKDDIDKVIVIFSETDGVVP
jgi:hypothetical protein